ncbi:hypothetical protein [Nocardioides gilvus]|uniref:hypothetical protein n=1 Tax=Nocardioides gilvus TaxID=1735589 RepID=UPI000D74FB69|nr:hypothetical protein [Nocardioides gilvus]
MRTARTTLVAVATSTLLALSACGEDQTESEKAAEKFMQSMVDRDGDAFCSLIEIEGQPVAENEEALELCTGQADDAMPAMDDDERKEAEKSLEDGPEKSEEDGDKASVTYGTGDDAFDIDLVRIDGDWFVTLV